MGALRTVGAVFRAGAGFDGQQGADLDVIGVEDLSVNAVRVVQQIHKWAVQQLVNLVARPVVARRDGVVVGSHAGWPYSEAR